MTDHDSVDGVPEAAAAAARDGIRLVAAAEISTVDDVAPDLHVLGYLIDPTDSALREQLVRLTR